MAEVQAKTEVIELAVWKLVTLGATLPELQQALVKSGNGFIPERTLKLYLKRIREKRQKDPTISQEVARLKEQQSSRLMMFIRECLDKGKLSAIAPLERLWAEINGTQEPVKVETVERRGWDSLTPDELAYMRAHPGKLPPGRTLEELEHVT